MVSIRSLFQVNNTDAEGRLTFADALVYACNQGVDKVLLCSYVGNLNFFYSFLLALVIFENSSHAIINIFCR